MRSFSVIAAAMLAALAAQGVESQTLPAATAPTYADLADLALEADVVAHVEVRRARALGRDEAVGVPPGHRRFQIEADLVALIRGPALPPRIRWLVDLPDDSRGRPARLPRRAQLLLLADTVPGRADDLRLVAADSQFPFSPASADRLRSILTEAAAGDVPPRIVGIGRAFHVPGSLPGESETQIFLRTADERPISLTVLRRPGEQPRWAVALSEMVDNSATPPERESLLWYRLACTLPAELPAQSLSEAAPSEARAIRADYRIVIDRLGPCARTRATG